MMSNSEEGAQRFVITPHQGLSRLHYEEDDEAKLLEEAEETLNKMEDYLNNEPMTNMERERGVESAYYEDDKDTCSMCGGHLEKLGELGSKAWYRCRNCGMEFSKDIKKDGGTGFVDPETGETEDYCTDCKIDIGDMTPEQWAKHLQLGHEEEGETALLKKAEETLGRLKEEGFGGSDYIYESGPRCRHGIPTNKYCSVCSRERDYKEKDEEADDYCQLHKKYMGDHNSQELEDDLDQIARMRDEETKSDEA